VEPRDAFISALAQFGQPPRVGPGAVEALLDQSPQWFRIALAGALRPWPADAVAEVQDRAQAKGWDSADTAAVVRVMNDDYPELTVPDGLEPPASSNERWWAIDGDGIEQSIWTNEAGTLVLEVLAAGPSWAFRAAVLSADQVDRYRSEGLAALDEVTTRLRDGVR